MYRQVLDLYATSVDYNPKSSESIVFFKMVQNNLSGDFPTLKDIGIVKNYLNEEELKILNNIVSGYFDFAEIQAMRHNPMYMPDYAEHLYNVLRTTGEKLLQGAGTVSHAQAMEKATTRRSNNVELCSYTSDEAEKLCLHSSSDTETADIKNTEMYVEGFKEKLEKDTSYRGLWTVSFTLKEF